MKKIFALAFLFFAALPAGAQITPSIEIPNLTAFRGGVFGTFVHLQGGVTPGDGGEGYFGKTFSTCIDDGNTFVKDRGGFCFARLTSAASALTPQSLGAKCDGTTDDTAVFVAAQSLPIASGPIALNYGSCKIVGPVTLTRQMNFAGGMIKPSGTVTLNGPIVAPEIQIFDNGAGGVISGNMVTPTISVMWWGAKNDNTASAATVAAFQAANDYAQSAVSNNPLVTISIPTGTFNLGTGAYGVQSNKANWCPKFVGQGPGVTLINYSPSSEGAAFLFNPSIGQCNGGGVSNLRVSGNANTVGCEFFSTNVGVCSIQADNIKTLALLCSCSSGGFSENIRITILASSAAKNFIDYRTNNGGTTSFRDSGCYDCIVSLANGSTDAIVLVEGGSFPYSVPMNISVNVQSNGANYFIDNQSANLFSTYGDQQIEVDGTSTLTLAKSGGVSFGGSQQLQIAGTAQLIYGPSTYATSAGYVGAVQSFKNSFYIVDNAPSVVHYLTAGTGVTTTLSWFRQGAQQCNIQVYNGSTYNWAGQIYITQSGFGQYFMQPAIGHRFYGTNDPVFGLSTGSITVTMADAVAANSTRVFGVCYHAGEQD